jgi:BolA protein
MEVQQTIETKLRQLLAPTRLEVTNESHMHNVAPGSETHFRVLVVSSEFEGVSRVQRHRRVHRALDEELSSGVHALAVDAWTEAEWSERGMASKSPDCRGGAGR